jgi:hypothetical protein
VEKLSREEHRALEEYVKFSLRTVKPSEELFLDPRTAAVIDTQVAKILRGIGKPRRDYAERLTRLR